MHARARTFANSPAFSSETPPALCSAAMRSPSMVRMPGLCCMPCRQRSRPAQHCSGSREHIEEGCEWAGSVSTIECMHVLHGMWPWLWQTCAALLALCTGSRLYVPGQKGGSLTE